MVVRSLCVSIFNQEESIRSLIRPVHRYCSNYFFLLVLLRQYKKKAPEGASYVCITFPRNLLYHIRIRDKESPQASLSIHLQYLHRGHVHKLHKYVPLHVLQYLLICCGMTLLYPSQCCKTLFSFF